MKLKRSLTVLVAMVALIFVLSLGGSVAAQTGVFINEMQVSTSGTDWEFVELQGASGTDLSDLTLLGIESDFGTSAGTIDVVISLAGQSIPGDGFWLGINSTGASTYGVAGDLSIGENSFENSTATYFLVSNFNGASGDDLDTDSDGVLDITPWDSVLDSVNIRDSGASDFDYGAPSVGPDGSFLPSGTYRCPDAPSGTFGSNILNFSTPDGTPGFSNRSTCGEPDVYINEMQVSTSGTDWEFVELQGASGTDLSELTLLGVESDFGTSAGTIDLAISLAGQVIPADGFWLGINSTGASTYGVTGDLTIGENSFENSTATYFLVSNFTGASGDDLDANNDGILDSFPWDFVFDSLNIRDSGASDFDYGATSVGPDGTFLPSGTYRCPDAPSGTFDSNILNFSTPDGTPGVPNNCVVVGPQAAKIHEVQGSGDSVAITDPVIVEAVVVADFQSGSQLNGFFIQEEDGDVDGDTNTSEGIMVYCGGCDTDVAVGDTVQVTGLPGEYFAMSQIDTTVAEGLVTVVSSGNPLPSASTVNLPAAADTRGETTFEPVEGMLVTFPDTLVVSEYFELARYGQLVLTVGERPRQFTDANAPDVDGYAAFLADLSTRRIILDDDNNIQNDAITNTDKPYFWPRDGLSNTNLIRGGDSIDNLTGVLHWSWAGQGGTDAWRVRPVDINFNYDFTPNLVRPATPVEVGGSLKVASFNVLNYFATVDDGPNICGPDFNLDCRGADSEAELARQRDKIVSAMITMDADIIGLMELQNDDSASIQHLVDGLNAVAGAGAYDFIDTGYIGTDAIKVGLIYKTATVTPKGDFAILDSTVDPTFLDDKNRPALAQTFEEIISGGELTVAVNHLKSKGSACDDVEDPDLNDGQANCSQTRKDAAIALANWLATDPTHSGDPDFLIIGDLNSYRMEDPITALKANGYTDLLDAVVGPDAYTYLFDGQLGYLDYAMSNATLGGQLSGVTAWNINADEIPVFDYNDDIRDSGESSFERESGVLPIYESNAYRASDHDPVLTGMDLNGSPDCTGAFASPSELSTPNHKMVTIEVFGVTDPEGDPFTINIDGIFQDEPVNADDDGNTSPDAEGVDTSLVQVRSERSGEGNGRVYTIYFTASDSTGSCSSSVIVSVPLSNNGVPAVDDGPIYNSTIVEP